MSSQRPFAAPGPSRAAPGQEPTSPQTINVFGHHSLHSPFVTGLQFGLGFTLASVIVGIVGGILVAVLFGAAIASMIIG